MFIGWNNQMQSEYEIRQIPYSETKHWILNIHYAKRMPSISFAYGLYRHDEMVERGYFNENPPSWHDPSYAGESW